MPEPTQVAVLDDVVTASVVMTGETVEEWRELGLLDMLWPGCEMVDVTDVVPRPGIHWTRHTTDQTHPWRPPSPGESFQWNNDGGYWYDPTPPDDQPTAPTPD